MSIHDSPNDQLRLPRTTKLPLVDLDNQKYVNGEIAELGRKTFKEKPCLLVPACIERARYRAKFGNSSMKEVKVS